MPHDYEQLTRDAEIHKVQLEAGVLPEDYGSERRLAAYGADMLPFADTGAVTEAALRAEGGVQNKYDDFEFYDGEVYIYNRPPGFDFDGTYIRTMSDLRHLLAALKPRA